MLCHFGQSRSSSVFNHFGHSSSVATNSATSENRTVPESIGQNEEAAKGNEGRIRNKPSPAPKNFLNDAQNNHAFILNI